MAEDSRVVRLATPFMTAVMWSAVAMWSWCPSIIGAWLPPKPQAYWLNFFPYRLGTLGFLALKDGVTNGNYGIADQVRTVHFTLFRSFAENW